VPPPWSRVGRRPVAPHRAARSSPGTSAVAAMSILEVAVFAVLVTNAADPFFCRTLAEGGARCSNGLGVEATGEHTIRFSNFVTVTKLNNGDLAFSNGLTSSRGSFGGYQFSNGVSVRRLAGGIYEFSSGLICRPRLPAIAECVRRPRKPQ